MIAVSVAEISQTASLLVLESLQIKYCDGAGDMLGEGWSTGLQGKGHHREKDMSWEGLPMGRKPCCWQSSSLLLLSTGLVGSSIGRSVLLFCRHKWFRLRYKGLCGHSHLSADQL